MPEDSIVHRFDGGGDEETSGVAQRGKMFDEIQKMLDFDGDIVAETGKLAMQLADDGQSVRGTVEKIGIAKGDVFGAGTDLPADIFEHHFARNDAENPIVDGNNRTVAAEMLAAAAGLGVTRDKMDAIGQHHVRVFVQRRKASAVGHDEIETVSDIEGDTESDIAGAVAAEAPAPVVASLGDATPSSSRATNSARLASNSPPRML